MKGNGTKRGRPPGHNKTTINGKVIYMHGLGCRHFPNCFECPFRDCIL